MGVLRVYARSLGQLINFEKSSVFFNSNVADHNKVDVWRILDVPYIDSLKKYSSLSCVVGRNKKNDFVALRDRIKSRISSWSTHMLSIEGREVFIKFVL